MIFTVTKTKLHAEGQKTPQDACYKAKFEATKRAELWCYVPIMSHLLNKKTASLVIDTGRGSRHYPFGNKCNNALKYLERIQNTNFKPQK